MPIFYMILTLLIFLNKTEPQFYLKLKYIQLKT